MSDSEDNATGGSEMKPAKSLYLPGEKGAICGVKTETISSSNEDTNPALINELVKAMTKAIKHPVTKSSIRNRDSIGRNISLKQPKLYLLG